MRCSAVLLLSALVLLPAAESDWFRPLGPPPKATPRRINGGEGVPPLPLPATPLRRSERKRQPSPPVLIGKVVWGEAGSFVYDGGEKADIADWNLCPGDLQGVLGKARAALGEPFTSEPVPLATFHGDPARTPALFFSGVRSLRLSDAQVALLKDYVQRGGMVVFDSVAGSPYFTESARELAARLLPTSPLRPLAPDHPLFHLLVDVDKAGYGSKAPSDQPRFEGAWLGSRVAVLLSPVGLGCGWDDREVPGLPQAVFYDVPTAQRLGVNLIGYIVGNGPVGQAEAKPELFAAADARPAANEFVFAQVVHRGHWDVHPGAAARLLAGLRRDAALNVSLKRVAVEPGKDDLTPYAALWMDGVEAPAFDDRARAALRTYLAGPGLLIVNGGLGAEAFVTALRQEVAALVPGASLRPLAPDHPLFACAAHIGAVGYTAAALTARPGLNAPYLEGVQAGDALKVVLSPFDLIAGWDGLDRPGAKAWAPEGAVALGGNLVVWASTH